MNTSNTNKMTIEDLYYKLDGKINGLETRVINKIDEVKQEVFVLKHEVVVLKQDVSDLTEICNNAFGRVERRLQRIEKMNEFHL